MLNQQKRYGESPNALLCSFKEGNSSSINLLFSGAIFTSDLESLSDKEMLFLINIRNFWLRSIVLEKLCGRGSCLLENVKFGDGVTTLGLWSNCSTLLNQHIANFGSVKQEQRSDKQKH